MGVSVEKKQEILRSKLAHIKDERKRQALFDLYWQDEDSRFIRRQGEPNQIEGSPAISCWLAVPSKSQTVPGRVAQCLSPNHAAPYGFAFPYTPYRAHPSKDGRQ